MLDKKLSISDITENGLCQICAKQLWEEFIKELGKRVREPGSKPFQKPLDITRIYNLLTNSRSVIVQISFAVNLQARFVKIQQFYYFLWTIGNYASNV